MEFQFFRLIFPILIRFKGLVCLEKIGFKVEKYISFEIDKDAKLVSSERHGDKITQLGDIRLVNHKTVKTFGKVDLLLGGSPCNNFSLANPKRENFGKSLLTTIF